MNENDVEALVNDDAVESTSDETVIDGLPPKDDEDIQIHPRINGPGILVYGGMQVKKVNVIKKATKCNKNILKMEINNNVC